MNAYRTTLAGALIALSTICSAGNEPAAVPAVDELFSEYDLEDTPGCALGVIRDGDFIYRQGYGMANLEYDIPISSSSVFRIASTSKQFTAVAIALLVESGKVSLQDPVRRYFPELPEWAEEMTVMQLLQHTSGIRDYLTLAWLVGLTEYTDHYTTEWVLDMLVRQKEGNFEPGSDFLYSNTGYMLLAQLVERVSGQTMREFSEEYIFGPLGMVHSRFQDNHAHIVRNRAAGYEPGEAGFDINMTTLNLVGDGAVFTSIDDLLYWDRNFYNNRLGKGSPELIEQMTGAYNSEQGDSTAYTPGPNGGIYYAFGLERDNYRGLTRISHSGGFAGFRADMMRFPDQMFTVAVLCNRSDATPTRLATQVADYYLQDQMQAVEDDGPTMDTSLSAQSLAIYTGEFWDSKNMVGLKVENEDGKLWAEHPELGRFELAAIGQHRWHLIDCPWDVKLVYEIEGGAMRQLDTLFNDAAWGSFKPFKRAEPGIANLAAYAGTYYSPELDIEYQIGVDQDQLNFVLKGEHPQELTPVLDGMYENTNWGVFEFERNPEGQVDGFLLHSGRVRNLAFQRRE